MDLKLKTITREEANAENMEIWEGNDKDIFYARKQHGQDRESALYGYVFTITN